MLAALEATENSNERKRAAHATHTLYCGRCAKSSVDRFAKGGPLPLALLPPLAALPAAPGFALGAAPGLAPPWSLVCAGAAAGALGGLASPPASPFLFAVLPPPPPGGFLPASASACAAFRV